MTIAFSQQRIGDLVLKNRFIRSATHEGLADEFGAPTEKLIDLWRNLATGQVAMILTGYSYVSPEGRQGPGMSGISSSDNPKSLAAWRLAATAIHEAGGLVCMQLVHVGGQIHNQQHRLAAALSPSGVEHPSYHIRAQTMSKADIHRIVSDFAEAAARAQQAGFDAVQIHAAHGYLLSQFLSPLTNLRQDEYGGSLENRFRLIGQIYQAIRAKIGSMPILLKINSSDFFQPGLTPDESFFCISELASQGLDAVEISGGTPYSGRDNPSRMRIKQPKDEAYFRQFAKRVKDHLSLPVILVGGIRSLEVAEQVLENAEADFLSMSRPLIREPQLISRWLASQTERSHCISCNRCFKEADTTDGVACYHTK